MIGRLGLKIVLPNSCCRNKLISQGIVSNNRAKYVNPQDILGKCLFFSLPGITGKKKEYSGKKLVGFTMEQMYDVVSDVENYKTFVPFCIKSTVRQKRPNSLSGELEVGFPPIVERYTSRVTLKKPTNVNAVCFDGKLFDHLTTRWSFRKGIVGQPKSCIVDFYLSFEFKSALHSQLANIFFDELVLQMESAFEKEAERRFGSPSIKTQKLKA